MSEPYITVCIGKNNKNTNAPNNVKNNSNLLDYSEIKKECLNFFYGCWIKCINNRTKEFNNGGFLVTIQGDSVRLRNIKNGSELIDFDISSYTFYAKNKTEQYFFMQKITNEIFFLNKELDRLKDISKYDKDKTKFYKLKNKFFNLILDGRVKIL